MITIIKDRSFQMELDLETDRIRLDRNDWKRALEENLHALQDYVHPHQLIIWRPGPEHRSQKGRHTLDVQLTTSTSCTCSRFKLRDRCEHIAFARHLEAAGIAPDTDTPVRANDITEREVAA